jgi:hypothetical protein
LSRCPPPELLPKITAASPLIQPALFDHIQRLFAFVDYEGVDPTNNSAERALRTGVQWRKTSFGNRSANGELATARLLTVAETCDLQKLNILPSYPVPSATPNAHIPVTQVRLPELLQSS